MEKHCTTVYFILKKTRKDKDGLSPIVCYISVSAERTQFYTGKKIRSTDWDSEKQLMKGKSVDARLINEYINQLRQKILKKEIELMNNGLGITGIQILPHYNKTRDMILDGKRLFEDITYGDSIGHTFYAIPDGSYFYSNGVTLELRGEGFSISDSKLSYIPPTELTKDPSEVEAPQYPWYEGQGRGMFDDDREETGDETDNFDNIAGVLRY